MKIKLSRRQIVAHLLIIKSLQHRQETDETIPIIKAV
jgi:hypothetical protein